MGANHIIEPSPHEAVAATSRRLVKLDDLQPYLLKTTDYGKSWQPIVEGIPTDLITRVCREDPARRGLCTSGPRPASTLVWMTARTGSRWGTGCRLSRCTIWCQDDELVLATHGRSFWILDDLSPLRQLTEPVRKAAIYLFSPRTTTRAKMRGPSLKKGGPGAMGGPAVSA